MSDQEARLTNIISCVYIIVRYYRSNSDSAEVHNLCDAIMNLLREVVPPWT